ncbi:hypothetical protein N601_10370 [Rhodococcus erythropolis DN1]|nr:hypothetical protein N601_10370 [Rhodococcus erythropolis DN1]
MALAGSLQIETGVATAGEKLLALAHIDDEWKLAMPSTSNFVRVGLLIPDVLPRFSARFNPAVMPPK